MKTGASQIDPLQLPLMVLPCAILIEKAGGSMGRHPECQSASFPRMSSAISTSLEDASSVPEINLSSGYPLLPDDDQFTTQLNILSIGLNV
jgi:hypothetical protein